MRVNIFKNTELDSSISMHVYANNLIQRLIGLRGLEINSISIRGTRLPFIKDAISKDLFYPLYASSQKADVNHILDHSYGSLAYLLDPRKTVVTCHDLNPLEYPPQSTWLGRERFLYNIRGMLRAKYIIADSESTKKTILKYFDYQGEIKVIYLGVDHEFACIEDEEKKKELKNKYKLHLFKKYLLHVGVSYPYKNVEILLRNLKFIPNCGLIKVGSFSKLQERLISKLNLSSRIMQFKNIDKSTLIELYNIADVLVFPSFCEGFGLPVLEAMACGCPVICSQIPILSEIGANIPFFINPHSDFELQKAVLHVLNNGEARGKMIRLGLEQVKKFKWEYTAGEVAKVYQRIVQGE